MLPLSRYLNVGQFVDKRQQLLEQAQTRLQLTKETLLAIINLQRQAVSAATGAVDNSWPHFLWVWLRFPSDDAAKLLLFSVSVCLWSTAVAGRRF